MDKMASEIIPLNKKIYVKNQYEKVIDTKFSQLANPPSSLTLTEESTISIEEFFQNYNQLFLQIPKIGETNSHEFLIKTSLEYVGSAIIDDTIQALIDEINLLQQTNLELNQQLIELQNPEINSISEASSQLGSTNTQIGSTNTRNEVQRATRGRG